MAVGAFPAAKLGLVLIKQISKPIANGIASPVVPPTSGRSLGSQKLLLLLVVTVVACGAVMLLRIGLFSKHLAADRDISCTIFCKK